MTPKPVSHGLRTWLAGGLMIMLATADLFPGETAAVDPTTAKEGAVMPEINAAAWAALERAIRERYSHRDRVVADWPAQFAAQRERAVAAATPRQFAGVAAAVLGAAADVHLTLRVGAETIGTHPRHYVVNYDQAGIRRSVSGIQMLGRGIAVGAIERTGESPVAYLAIAQWPSDVREMQPALDFVRALPARGVDRLILDVRMNAGGDERSAQALAALFVRQPTVYARHRFRDPQAPGGWTAMAGRTIAPAGSRGEGGGGRFAGRVAVLQGPRCLSSNESFLLMMRHGAHAALVGGVSGGSSGNPRPIELGNGVTALVPSWQAFDADGTVLEGRGVVPDVVVTWSAPADSGPDPIIEKALSVLAAGATPRP